MYGVEKKPDVTIEIGDGVVVIRRKGVSRPTVAILLEHKNLPNGSQRLILDRVVHKPGETILDGWGVEGAFVTVMRLAT